MAPLPPPPKAHQRGGASRGRLHGLGAHTVRGDPLVLVLDAWLSLHLERRLEVGAPLTESVEGLAVGLAHVELVCSSF